jgi:UDP-N-acetylmuramoylalanine--D-glutamate ligase
MKPFADCHRFFVLGMARSGVAVADLLVRHGHAVTVHDDDAGALARFAASDAVRAHGERIRVAGPGDAAGLLAESDCLVVSPGVPLENALVGRARALDLRVAGEIEAAFHYTRARIVGVTGTNGKSTTVGVIGDILKAGGIDAVVCGNVGTPLAQVLLERDPHTLVLELSSFQLDTIDEFRVGVAVLLNVTPDHLDRYHHSFDEYAASKERILNRADARTCYVYNDDDAVARAIRGRHPGVAIPFSSTRVLERGLFFEDDRMVRAWDGGREEIIRRSEFTPVGVHNLENALASIAVATALGVPLEAVRAALRAYRPLPHRMELVRVVDGVAYVNDSKATNVDATVKSLISIEGHCVLMLGGRDKEGNFAALVPHLGGVRRVVLLGESKHVIRRALAGHCEMTDARDMADAVQLARASARAGDTVLLAPACASFDMFRNYQERGEVFRAAVNAL